MDSFVLETGIEFNALFLHTNFELVASANDAIDGVELPVSWDIIGRKESLELFLRLNDVNLMIGAEEGSELMLSVLVQSRVRLELWVAIVCLIVVGDSLAS